MAADELGYFIAEGCLSPEKCESVAKDLSSVGTGRAGARHLMANRAVSELAAQSCLIELAREWLGGGAVPFRATLFEKSHDVNWLIPWHQDTALPLAARFERDGWGPWSMKQSVSYAHAPAWALERVIALRVHLDASSGDNGPLRVIPGSHLHGVLSDPEVLNHVADGQEVACLVQRGGVIGMRPLLIHSSSKARSSQPRRVLHIEYADSLELGAGIKLAVV